MWFHRLIKWSFYSIFFAVPLIMWPSTYELFEFNKMWFVFGISLLILFFWAARIINNERFFIRRTPLDIPIILFVISQIVSTIWSLDSYVSFWGYYSRFNGGLLSTLTYVFLYYAWVSNMTYEKDLPPANYSDTPEISKSRMPAKKENKAGLVINSQQYGNNIHWMLFVIFLSGIFVSLWGFPSHYGADPTCFAFRGTFDVTCWTDAFQPMVRIFSTLGQPNWLAAFLSVVIPVTVAFGLQSYQKGSDPALKYKNLSGQEISLINPRLTGILFLGSAVFMYVNLLFTRSQSGFGAFWIGIIVFFVVLIGTILKYEKSVRAVFASVALRIFAVFLAVIFVTTLAIGSPVEKLNLLAGKIIPRAKPVAKTQTTSPPAAVGELGGTDSGTIRKYVWEGAIKLFQRNLLFGTGVETFGFAYYSARPAAHNLTSEWDYLYNKAHNEYLNYAATTGAFGLGSYLAFIFLFLFIAFKAILFLSNSPPVSAQQHKLSFLNQTSIFGAALVGGFITILVSNFFGFSVVITNLYLFLIPAFFFTEFNMLGPLLTWGRKDSDLPARQNAQGIDESGAGKIISLLILAIIIGYFEFLLNQFWRADIKYSYGYNLDRVGEYIQATPYLQQAVGLRPGEDVFQDEYSTNLSTLALIASQQNLSTQAAQLSQQAKQISDDVTARHPNNILFLKNRTRVFYALSQIDKSYLKEAYNAIDRARKLAPTDAKILYNEALIAGQLGNKSIAVDMLEQTIGLKPNYTDAYYALALFYEQLAKEEKDPQKALQYNTRAKQRLQILLQKYAPNDKKAKDLLKSL